MAFYKKYGYRGYRSNAKPQVHTITVKYAGECACCGGLIQPGAIADYYPIGRFAFSHRKACVWAVLTIKARRGSR